MSLSIRDGAMSATQLQQSGGSSHARPEIKPILYKEKGKVVFSEQT